MAEALPPQSKAPANLANQAEPNTALAKSLPAEPKAVPPQQTAEITATPLPVTPSVYAPSSPGSWKEKRRLSFASDRSDDSRWGQGWEWDGKDWNNKEWAWEGGWQYPSSQRDYWAQQGESWWNECGDNSYAWGWAKQAADADRAKWRKVLSDGQMSDTSAENIRSGLALARKPTEGEGFHDPSTPTPASPSTVEVKGAETTPAVGDTGKAADAQGETSTPAAEDAGTTPQVADSTPAVGDTGKATDAQVETSTPAAEDARKTPQVADTTPAVGDTGKATDAQVETSTPAAEVADTTPAVGDTGKVADAQVETSTPAAEDAGTTPQVADSTPAVGDTGKATDAQVETSTLAAEDARKTPQVADTTPAVGDTGKAEHANNTPAPPAVHIPVKEEKIEPWLQDKKGQRLSPNALYMRFYRSVRSSLDAIYVYSRREIHTTRLQGSVRDQGEVR